nr:RHS repeat-associated core domain-containing protein [Alcanivorax sp. 1008]
MVNGQVTEKYLWLDKTTLLAIYDGNNNLKQRFEYTLGHTPTSFTQNGNRYYIATDHLGSMRAISDASGNIVKAVSYDSYGNTLNDSNPSFVIPFGFAGGLQDRDTGLIRFGFRDYDPSVGRWTARDPIGLGDGPNIYAYVRNDPVRFVDPTGRYAHIIAGGLIGGVGNALGTYFAGNRDAFSLVTSFAIGAGTGAAFAATGGAAGGGSALAWMKNGLAAGAITGGGTELALNGLSSDVAVQTLMGASVGILGGGIGNAAALKSALQQLHKGLGKNISRSDLAGALTDLYASLFISFTADQLAQIIDQYLEAGGSCN